MAETSAPQRARDRPYRETIRCPGGALCLDFCNTGQAARAGRATDWLANFGDLVDWLAATGALTEGQAARFRRTGAASAGAAASVWRRALDAREVFFRVLNTAAAGGAVTREDLASIETEYPRVMSFARLNRAGERFAWSLDGTATALDAVMVPVVESAVSLLTSDRLARLRRCGNSTCYWLFIDETRNHSRRWCEMASCGNVLKVRRHRAKARKLRN